MKWRTQYQAVSAHIQAVGLSAALGDRFKRPAPGADPRGGTQYAPMAFTEQGVAMLSSVLNSPRAIQVNIAIMCAFVRLREFLASQAKLSKRLHRLEQKVVLHGKAIGTLFDAMQQMASERPPAIDFQYAALKRKQAAALRAAAWKDFIAAVFA